VDILEFYMLSDDSAWAGSRVALLLLVGSPHAYRYHTVSCAGSRERTVPVQLPQVSVGTGRGKGGIVACT